MKINPTHPMNNSKQAVKELIMFNTYITKNQDRLVPYEKTVHEHKAPTDDSIKLLNEMQEKARLSLIDQIHLTNNNLHIEVRVYTDYFAFGNVADVAFVLNGQRHTLQVKFEDYRRTDMIRHVFRKVSEEITEKTMMLLFDIAINNSPPLTNEQKAK